MAEFTAAVENYDRFMGRYATGLASKFADAACVRAGMRVLDVGCGPGALAVELAARVGEDKVAAIDPAPRFAAACQARVPGADMCDGVAESLPWRRCSRWSSSVTPVEAGGLRQHKQGL